MLTAAAVGLLLAPVSAAVADGGVTDAEAKLQFESPGGGVAQIKSLAGKPTDLVVPADILRKVATGADRLQLVEFPLGEMEGPPMATVSGTEEVKTLLDAIETPPVDANSYNHHLCIGHPPIRLFRGKKLLAEFSFDHESMLRPLSKGLWPGGDVDVTRASARAIAQWFKRHGYSGFANGLDDQEKTAATWRSFLEVFPEQARLLFRELDDGLVALANPRSEDTAADAGQPEDPVARAIPDDTERLRLICRALGLLDSRWDEFTSPERLILDSASRIAPATIAEVVGTFADNSLELQGAARLLFRGPMGGRGVIHNLDLAKAERLAAKAARQVFSGGDSQDARRLVWILEDYLGEETLAVLAEHAARARQEPDPDGVGCDRSASLEDEWSPLSALVVLAERRRANHEDVVAFARRSWHCPKNTAATRLALAFACERLPSEADLKAAGATSGERMLWRMKELRTRESIDLVFSALLDHRRVELREQTSKWLTKLSKLEFAKEVSAEDRSRQLRAWWDGARAGWKEPAPAAARVSKPDAAMPEACSLLDAPLPMPEPRVSRKANALAPKDLPQARTPAEKAAKARFLAGLRLAADFDRRSLLVKGEFSNDARRAKRQAGGKAQREFLAVCDAGSDEWCLASDYASGLLFEQMGDAHLDLPCPKSMVEFAHKMGGCDWFEGAERSKSFRKAGSWYRAALRKCETPALANSPWCGQAREGLERLRTKVEWL